MNDYIYGKYEGLRDYLEKGTLGSQLLIYGVSSGMLIAAFVKRRSTYNILGQFKKPSHVPHTLLEKRATLTGTVRDIQQHDAETLLMLVSRRAWVPWFSDSQRPLPVKLAGVKLNGNGHAWLQTCLVGRPATFVAIKDDTLVLLHPLQNKEAGQLLDVSEVLLKLGFAELAPNAQVTKPNVAYFKQLKNIAAVARSRDAWRAWACRHPWIWYNWHNLKSALLPKQHLLPKILR